MNNAHQIPGSLSLDFFTEEDLRAEKKARKKFRLNVIGVGAMGQEHIWTALKIGSAEINGIYDPNKKSIESCAKWFGDFSRVVKYPSLEDAVLDPGIDGLIIATPNFHHVEAMRTARLSTKPILLEKPMASNLRDAWEIVEMAKNRPAPVQVALEYRQKAVYLEAFDHLKRRKSIGDPLMVQITEHRAPFLHKVNQWNKFSEYSGGTLVEKCCHYFDLFNLCAGPEGQATRVYASGGMAVNFKDFEFRGKKSDIIDHAFVTVEYSSGMRACLNLCMFSYGAGAAEEMIINGTEGRIKAVDVPREHLSVWRKGAHPSLECGVAFPPHVATTGNHGGSTWLEHEIFYRLLAGEKADFPTVIDGFQSVLVGVAAEESIKSGKPVDTATLLAATQTRPY